MNTIPDPEFETLRERQRADTATNALETLAKSLAEAREVLRAVEWCKLHGCPVCDAPKSQGHAPGCKLAKVIA